LTNFEESWRLNFGEDAELRSRILTNLSILRTSDADLRLYITTVQDGWRKSAFLTR
jgi:hypothetical protein